MAKKLSKAAQACVSREISKHCKTKKRRCKIGSERAQAAAISYSVCRRKGFRTIPARR